MDRETLIYLLSSGKFLCFNPGELDGTDVFDEPPLEITPQLTTSIADPNAPPVVPGREPLFDSPLFARAVFFKEATVNHDDEIGVATRVLILFNEDDAREGGASVSALPDEFEPAINKWFGGKIEVTLTPHDRNVLDVFCRSPTFDPFLLLAHRADIERERKVDQDWFAVDPRTAASTRAIIADRAKRLVDLALDDHTSDERYKATVEALQDAIWTCRTNDRTGRLFRSIGIPRDQVERVLFAWKGIAYYEFLYREFSTDYTGFLAWLSGNDSLPRDAKHITQRQIDMIKSKRRQAQTVMRGFYSNATDILKNHEAAHQSLLKEGNPVPFQQFLLAAPTMFETLGISIGTFGHARNAWKTLTNGGRRPKRNADALEGFYRFIQELGATPLSRPGAAKQMQEKAVYSLQPLQPLS